jgi:hypothetical protein
MILARMWLGVNIWRWSSFPFTFRDQNCVMSSVILAFWRPILVWMYQNSVLPDSFCQKMKRRFWLECDEQSLFLTWFSFPFTIEDQNCEIWSVNFSILLTNWGWFVAHSEANSFQQKMKRWFWLECGKWSMFLTWFSFSIHRQRPELSDVKL